MEWTLENRLKLIKVLAQMKYESNRPLSESDKDLLIGTNYIFM